MSNDSIKKQMKISELEQRTGIPRETIHYYIREGLLPAPVKKGLRLAYYDESYVGLIDLIKKLQEERYLPLAVIKNLFLDQKYNVDELEKAFLSDLFGKAGTLKKVGLEKVLQDMKSKPLPKGYLEQLCSCGLLSKDVLEEGAEPTELELKLAQLCMRGEALGFNTKQMRTITELVEKIVEEERVSLTDMLRHKESPKEFVAAMKDRQSFMEEFLIYQRARLIQRAVQEFVSQAESTRVRWGENLISIPSEAFRKRYKIDEQIDKLRAEAEKERDEKKLNRVAWALFLSGRHDDLRQMDDRRRSDRFRLAVAYANAMAGDIEPAVKWSERAVKKNAEDPFFLSLAAGLYMLFASKSEGFIESTIWASKGLDLLEEAARFKPETTFDALSIDFVRSFLYLTLPEPFGRTEEGRKGLENLVKRVSGKERDKLDAAFEGELEIFEVSSHFFLAEAAALTGDKGKAREHFRRVIELDPASDFGSKAFVRLGEIG